MSDSISGNIYDIQKFSVHDGPGIRTDIFLKGCPLSCLWCHSPESQSFAPDLAWMEIRCIGIDLCGLCLQACPNNAVSPSPPTTNQLGEPISLPIINRDLCTVCLACANACPSKALYNTLRPISLDDCMKSIRQDKSYYQKSGGGVTISGGEPMSQFDFTFALANQCQEEGFHVALDTTGFAPSHLFEQITPLINLFLFDLKHMDSNRSKKLTGVPNELILHNARLIASLGGRFQFRFPIIPHLNDSPDNIQATADFCASIKDSIDLIQLLPYHKLGLTKYLRLGRKYRMNVEPPSNDFMHEQLEFFTSFGLPTQIH